MLLSVAFQAAFRQQASLLTTQSSDDEDWGKSWKDPPLDTDVFLTPETTPF